MFYYRVSQCYQMRGNHPCNATAPLNLACRLNEEDYFQYPFAHAAVTAFPYLTLGKEEKSLQKEKSWQRCVLAPNQISHGWSHWDIRSYKASRNGQRSFAEIHWYLGLYPFQREEDTGKALYGWLTQSIYACKRVGNLAQCATGKVHLELHFIFNSKESDSSLDTAS